MRKDNAQPKSESAPHVSSSLPADSLFSSSLPFFKQGVLQLLSDMKSAAVAPDVFALDAAIGAGGPCGEP